MLKKLNELNNIKIYSVTDGEFTSYGKIIDIDTAEIIGAAEKFDMPENVIYMPSTPEFEKLPIAEKLKNGCYGTLPTQVGYCYGHSTGLNATEWHSSSEINIAATDLVLILGHVWEIKDDRIDSSLFRALFIPKGTAVEIYATTLHYCPCQVSDGGFRCIVALPSGTNTALETETADKKLLAKNKWLIAHIENEAKRKSGAVMGITGENYHIKY